MMGPGFVSQKKAAYEQTNDLRYVWAGGDITPLYKPSELEGYPGHPGRGVGRGVHEERALRRQPAADALATLVHPTAVQSGPADTPMDDARDRWFLDASEPDIMADLKRWKRR